MSKKQKHTLILGGGIAGLATAAILEKQGTDYLLLEALDEFGGLARGQKEQDVWLDFGLKSLPVGDIDNNPLLKLKKLLGLQFNVETVLDAPLTFQKSGFAPFVGFGETKKRSAAEAMEYYSQSPRLLVSSGWKALIDELLTIIPEKKRRTKSFVTKFITSQNQITGAVVNGDDTLHAENYVSTFSPKNLTGLLPANGFHGKSLQKILKSEALTALSLDLATKTRVTEHKNLFILNDDDFYVTGQFISNADPLRNSHGFQISTWITFMTDEEASSDEDVSKTIKAMKKVIKKAFPAIFAEGSPSWERLIVAPGAVGRSLAVQHSIENLFTIGGQTLYSGDFEFTGGALAGAMAVAETLLSKKSLDAKNLVESEVPSSPA